MSMRSRVALVGALLVAVLPSAPALAGRPAMTCTGTGRVRTCDVALPTGVKVSTGRVRVVVPADYDRSRRRYPVVVVLHGVGDSYSSWTDPGRGNLAALTTTCQAVFVMPDGGSGPKAGW